MNRSSVGEPDVGVRRRVRIAGLVLVTVVALGGATACGGGPEAIDAADLVGEWTPVEGASVGARNGSPQGSDHATESGGFLHPDVPAIAWTLRIDEANAGGFLGEWCSPKLCEPAVGAVRRDGTAVMADEDSTFTLARYGDELELCVVSPGETFQVAVCFTLRRS